ncbi:Dam family site-specific DNA-(adenine-N6)-methyltransferase [Campylobacter lari]|nr:Dam family site-specific DNA-(adenine-N6)-methyltransferase [Campylobacter lari]EAJ0341433.1 Dam family site-specific DNA-(adenine-N6)-methyltransferase [Campylobacter lari]EIV6476063.1 Dam family site-specific DNA-(adenine-N6)-methyltransferase [Campylobacter lari]EKL1313799.1 Dam family site-specific DNA-(adenine-N6)-methyltransferase [Campylobacter lari]
MRKGLINLFPKKINKFIDVFAGSASISMNTKAKFYIINDIDDTLRSYYQMFLKYEADEIINHIKQRIAEFNLPQKTTIRCFSDKEEVDKYKKAYHIFRDQYNKNKNVLDLYTLMFFAFSQQFRTNKKGDFNMPFGNNYFSTKNEKNITIGHSFFKKNISFYKENFIDLIDKINISKDDFVYFDPPYRITTATYNENNSWNQKDDILLYNVCEKLDKNGINFGLSNVFINKNIENTLLKEFCIKNNLNIYTPNNFKYHACGKENIKQQEVFICNYEIESTEHDFNYIKI